MLVVCGSLEVQLVQGVPVEGGVQQDGTLALAGCAVVHLLLN